MSLARSTFYYKVKNRSVETQKDEADLQGRIEEICAEWSCYGYRRVTAGIQAVNMPLKKVDERGYKICLWLNNHVFILLRAREMGRST